MTTNEHSMLLKNHTYWCTANYALNREIVHGRETGGLTTRQLASDNRNLIGRRKRAH